MTKVGEPGYKPMATQEEYHSFLEASNKASSLTTEFFVCVFASITAIILLWKIGGWYSAVAIGVAELMALRSYRNLVLFERDHPDLDRYSGVGPPG